MDQGCWLERVITSLMLQLVGGHTPKVSVQQIEKPTLRRSFAADNAFQQLRHLSRSSAPRHFFARYQILRKVGERPLFPD
jgi:hypothetical protein